MEPLFSADGSYSEQEIILNQNELIERYPHVSIPVIKMSPSRRVWCC